MKARFIFIIAAIAALLVFTTACSKKTETAENETNVTESTESSADTSATSTTDTSMTSTMASDTTMTSTTGSAATSTAPLEGADKDFAEKAAKGGNTEVTLGNLVPQRAASPDVKSFGQRMVDDHSKANMELQQLATAKGMTPAAEPNDDGKKEADKLSKLSGAAFDKEYMSFMVKDHKEDVEAFTKASEQSKDADLKAWATKTLPTLKEHLKLAEETAKKVGAK